ncbi:hypothetical protein IM792_05955 [Mucilaginibacter sp. JRF]|uniref:hypothetical protein n=1 Tax=Mucilaginibacter sp. JRF TaxID=2780088 RepID=UPI001880E045|nr:hypothetical protein [Mucilaginibacter sp. JRF]MBE9583986.1 hypothetical protein [Mucilaginibacter sp. JRF]
MKNLIKLSALTLAFVSLLTISTQAQDGGSKSTTTGSGIRLSVGPDFGLPVGSFHDSFNWSLGGSVQAEFPILKEQLYVTVNGGFQNYFAKEINGVTGEDLQLIPAKAGLKYFPVSNFYVQGEAGAAFLTNKSDVGATKSAAFVYAPQVGYLFNVGGNNYLDAGVRFEGNSKFTDNGKSNNLFALRVAYTFGL